jgi:uncharacterized protein YecT (DUF1311 family)
MGDGLVEILGLTLCASLVTAGVCSRQQDEGRRSSPEQAKVSIPKQGDDQQQWRQRLHAQAKLIFDAEAERERSGDCPTSSTTSEFDNCFVQRLKQTATNLEQFDRIIRQLQLGSPQISGAASETTAGSAGQERTPAQYATEFDALEKAWQQFREFACTAAFHQFDGGSDASSFQIECELKLTRDHMRELDLIYGSDLHL